MPEAGTLLLFAAAALALAVTPGPDMALLAGRATSQGAGAAFATLAGVQAGVIVHALALAVGLTPLIAASPLAFDALRYGGAAYLAWLAWRMLAAPPAAVGGEAPRVGSGRAFAQGLATNVLNPKVALFMLALLPQFVEPTRGAVGAQVAVLALVLNVVGGLVNGVIILAAAGLGRRFRGGSARWPRWLLAGVFAGLALRLAADGRR